MLEFFAFISEITCMVIVLVAFLHLTGIINIEMKIDNTSER